MNLGKHPELLERLASEYAIGAMRGGARRRFEALARDQVAVRAAALAWQFRLIGMTELQAAVEPSPAVWTRIDNLLSGQIQAQAMTASRAEAARPSRPWWESLILWRVMGASGIAVAVLVLVNTASVQTQLGQENARLQARLDAAPQLRYVAVLLDEKSNATLVASFDVRNKRLTVERLTGYQEAQDRSLQLWALATSGLPRSLGILGSERLVRLAADELNVREAPGLAISLEPKGGVTGESGPTGPVLFKGALIRPSL